jgi:hypothetical protein
MGLLLHREGAITGAIATVRHPVLGCLAHTKCSLVECHSTIRRVLINLSLSSCSNHTTIDSLCSFTSLGKSHQSAPEPPPVGSDTASGLETHPRSAVSTKKYPRPPLTGVTRHRVHLRTGFYRQTDSQLLQLEYQGLIVRTEKISRGVVQVARICE